MYNFRPTTRLDVPGFAPPHPPTTAPPRSDSVSRQPPVHLLRRLGAVCYDSLLLLAVLFAAGLPLPLIPEALRSEPWVRYTTFACMLLVSFVFFGWFWTHGGQTLGMRAWRIRVVTANSEPLSWGQAWSRFTWAAVSWAVFGLGFLWSLLDPFRLTWHDRFSATRLVRTRPLPAPQQERTDAQEQQGG